MPGGQQWSHLERVRPHHFPAGNMRAPRKGSREMKGTDKLLNAFDHVLQIVWTLYKGLRSFTKDNQTNIKSEANINF